jgi:hypothetical protein
MNHHPEQLPIFTGPHNTAPAAAHTHPHMTALEVEAAYVLPVLCRYWCAATTRKDWMQLSHWLDVLADNAALYKSADALDDFHQLQRLALHHRQQTPPAWKAMQENRGVSA